MLTLENQKGAGSLEQSTVEQESEAQALLGQIKNKDKKSKDKKSKMKWFVISMVLSVVLLIPFGLPLVDIGLLLLVILIHELGHFFAMRLFGYRDTTIFFIPLFGAAATGKKEKTIAWQEYVVFLAGPLPGILLGAGILFYMLLHNGLAAMETILFQFAIFSLVVNYFNLLPIFPLDGGKIVQTLLLSRYPKGQFYFYLFSLLIIVGSIFYFQSFFIVIFAVAIAMMFKSSYHLSTLLEKLFKEEDVNDVLIVKLLSSDEAYSKLSLPTKMGLATQALQVINSKKPSRLFMVFGLSFYLMLLASPLILKSFVLKGETPRKISTPHNQWRENSTVLQESHLPSNY